jgi:hypothetical protein
MAEKKKAVEKVVDKRKHELYTGVWILLMLAVLTVGEYFLAVIAPAWGTFLFFIAGLKAFWVIKDYMHIGRLFSSDEESH